MNFKDLKKAQIFHQFPRTTFIEDSKPWDIQFKICTSCFHGPEPGALRMVGDKMGNEEAILMLECKVQNKNVHQVN